MRFSFDDLWPGWLLFLWTMAFWVATCMAVFGVFGLLSPRDLYTAALVYLTGCAVLFIRERRRLDRQRQAEDAEWRLGG